MSEGTKTACLQLARRLEGPPRRQELRAVYLDLAALAGQIQGDVSEYRRAHGDTEATRQAEEALEHLKAQVRKVGLDIRLASDGAQQVGLQTAVRTALETLEAMSPA